MVTKVQPYQNCTTPLTSKKVGDVGICTGHPRINKWGDGIYPPSPGIYAREHTKTHAVDPMCISWWNYCFWHTFEFRSVWLIKWICKWCVWCRRISFKRRGKCSLKWRALRGSEATKRGRGCPAPTVGSFCIFLALNCAIWSIPETKNIIWFVVQAMESNIHNVCIRKSGREM